MKENTVFRPTNPSHVSHVTIFQMTPLFREAADGRITIASLVRPASLWCIIIVITIFISNTNTPKCEYFFLLSMCQLAEHVQASVLPGTGKTPNKVNCLICDIYHPTRKIPPEQNRNRVGMNPSRCGTDPAGRRVVLPV